MGILPYNYGQYGNNSINDSGYDIRRQLETRQAQLDKLNSQEYLSDEQLKRKSDLEKTVSVLQNRLDKQQNRNNGKSPSASPAKTSSPAVSTSTNKAAEKTFPEGRVIAKNPYAQSPYAQKPSVPENSYLKGFFFDARI